MVQHVIVESRMEAPLKPLIESAIRTELRVLELGVDRTRGRLRAFEERYNLSTEEFARRFSTGELAESLEFIEWAGEIETLQLLEAQSAALREARLN